MANQYRVGGNPASLDPQNLTKKLRSLQASVGAIKEDMSTKCRRYQAEKETQLASVSDQINDILNLIVENSALPLPSTHRIHGGMTTNGIKKEHIGGIKREASSDMGFGGSQRPPKMERMERASEEMGYGGSQKPPKMERMNSSGGSGNFTVNGEGFTEVYTDGACPDNGRDNARAGVGVWFGHGHKLNVSRPVVRSKQTNNAAEIQAASVAIQQAVDNGVNKLVINTDSQFLIKCVTEWMSNWKKNGWMTKSKQPVKNREDLEELDEAMNSGKIQVKWNHVKGHAGIEGNEEADKLAVKGAQMLR